MRVKPWPIAPADGAYVEVKCRLASSLHRVLEQVAIDNHVKPEQALNMLLARIARLVEHGDAAFLGLEYEYAWDQLVARGNAPLNGMPPINHGLLHRSPRKNSASGYVGVYPNGKNFRAMARNPEPGQPQVTVGTFRTAELAAWKRYLFYKEHQLAYGELEDFLQDGKGEAELYRVTLRNRDGREPSDAEIISEVNQDRREHPDPNFPEIEWDGPLPAPTITPPWQQPPPAPRDPNFVPRLPTREEMREDAKQAKLDNRPRVADPIPPLKYTSPEIEALLDAPEVPRSNGKAR